MFNIKTYNQIAAEGLAIFPNDLYTINSEESETNAILLRSHSLHNAHISNNLLAVSRAGAGVNNIPISQLSEQGIPVFNTPGANANAVKELVIAGMLIAYRNLYPALKYIDKLDSKNPNLKSEIEAAKKAFAGNELPGKTLAVIGLGAIGVQVANTANNLGMQVIGYDPAITIQSAWQLSADVEQSNSLETALSQADFISLHVPLLEQTRNLLNAKTLAKTKKGAILLNFARGEIVAENDIIDALKNKQLTCMVTDFPNPKLLNIEQVICLPHLGASTTEAETNCAVMAVRTLRNYLETGNIEYSVNFPLTTMPRNHGTRLTVANANIPNMLGQISTYLAKADLNIVDMINKSRENLAYTIVDIDGKIPHAVLEQIKQIDGVLRVRVIS